MPAFRRHLAGMPYRLDEVCRPFMNREEFPVKNKLSLTIASTVVLLPVVGCGGASGPAATLASNEKTTNIGQTVVKYFGQAKSFATTSSGDVSVFGFAATSSLGSLTYQPAALLNTTSLYFTRQVGDAEGNFVLPYPFYGPENVLVPSPNASIAAVCSCRSQVAFVQNGNLFVAHADGSGVTQFTTSGGVSAIAYSPNGGTIAYLYQNQVIYTIPYTGGTPTKIYTGIETIEPQTLAWSPNSSYIAFAMINQSEDAYNINQVPAVGGAAATNITPPTYLNYQWGNPCWSPDGTSIAASEVPPGENEGIGVFNVSSQSTVLLSPTSNNDSLPAFSPDGSQIAFYRSNAGGANPGIYEENIYGTNLTELYADPSSTGEQTGGLESLSWSPFQSSNLLVASSGTPSLWTATATGFLLSEDQSQFGSCLAFIAKTPADATITPPTSVGGSGPLVYQISADEITAMVWTNTVNGLRISVEPATSTVYVSIDAATGKVDSIVPAAVPAKATNSPAVRTYTGKFSAVYDGTGKNLAPGGATQVNFDAKTGKLVSAR